MTRTRKATKDELGSAQSKEGGKEQSKEQSPQNPPKEANKGKVAITKEPKKFMKKTVEAQVRIERSKHDRIFLLQATRVDDDSWKFSVMGTKDNHYTVSVSTELKCNCFDFKTRKKLCKHIFFIVTQVAQNDEILNFFKDSTKISKAAYCILDKQLKERLQRRLEGGKEKKQIDLKDDKDCSICFSEMDKQLETLDDCATCKKYFHKECIDMWKSHNPTCPLCRAALKGNTTDPLGRIVGIKL